MATGSVTSFADSGLFRPTVSGPERWYALYTKSNCEFKVSHQLSGRGFEEFLPVYRSHRQWSDRSRDIDMPLLAGYVFCRFDAGHPVPVISTPGVVRIVGAGRDPIPVSESELEAIRAICNSGLRAQPWPFLEVGRRVALVRGPLAGVEGIVVELKGECRLVVSVSLLQRSVAAEIEREWIQPC